jgi:hypothetical protein
VPDQCDERFEVVGDSADLSDAFFDALAALLLNCDERQDSELDAEDHVA